MTRFRPRGLPKKGRDAKRQGPPTGRVIGTKRYLLGMRKAVAGGRGRGMRIAFALAVGVLILTLLLLPLLSAML